MSGENVLQFPVRESAARRKGFAPVVLLRRLLLMRQKQFVEDEPSSPRKVVNDVLLGYVRRDIEKHEEALEYVAKLEAAEADGVKALRELVASGGTDEFQVARVEADFRKIHTLAGKARAAMQLASVVALLACALVTASTGDLNPRISRGARFGRPATARAMRKVGV